MLEPDDPHTGLPGIHRFASHARAWRDAEDWQWSARFAYQSIEKRGTGGGGFRTMYADFLEQVAPALPWIAELDAGRAPAPHRRRLDQSRPGLQGGLRRGRPRPPPGGGPAA
jgi:hypothetical protein